MLKSVVCKLGNMRKVKDWTVYPRAKGAGENPDIVVIQTSDRIAAINTRTGKALLSKACSSGAYFLHLNRVLGATEVDVPADVVAAVLDSIPQPGQEIGPGIFVA